MCRDARKAEPHLVNAGRSGDDPQVLRQVHFVKLDTLSAMGACFCQLPAQPRGRFNCFFPLPEDVGAYRCVHDSDRDQSCIGKIVLLSQGSRSVRSIASHYPTVSKLIDYAFNNHRTYSTMPAPVPTTLIYGRIWGTSCGKRIIRRLSLCPLTG